LRAGKATDIIYQLSQKGICQNLALIHGHCHDFIHPSKVLVIVMPCGYNSRLAESGVKGNYYVPFGIGSEAGACLTDHHLGRILGAEAPKVGFTCATRHPA
jgi:hypothetical protein